MNRWSLGLAISLLLAGCGGRLPLDARLASTQALILSPTTDRLYVFDLLRNRISYSLPTGQLPADVAVDRSGQLIFIANQMANSVSVFRRLDALNVLPVGQVGTPGRPTQVIINPVFPEAYVIFEDFPGLLVLDTRSTRAVAVGQLLRLPDGALTAIEVQADGQAVYAVDRTQHLHILTRASDLLQASQSIDLGPDKEIAELLLHQDKLYLSDRRLDAVHVFSLSANKIEKSIPLQDNEPANQPAWPKALAINPAGTKLYVAGYGTAAVYVIGIANQQLLQTIPLQGDSVRFDSFLPVSLDVTADNRRVYVTDSGSRNLSLIAASAEPESEDKLLRNIGTAASEGLLVPLGSIKILGSPK